MKKQKTKLTILEVVSKVLDSDLPLSTRNEITRHYLLPKLGMTSSVVENGKIDVGFAERPSAEEVRIENNPKLKAEFEDTERLMAGKEEDSDED